MPLRTAKPTMAEAEALLVSSRLNRTDEIVSLCAECLGFLTKEFATYCRNIQYCKIFIPHFTEHLTGLVDVLKKTIPHEQHGFSVFGEVHQKSFALFEDMALFVREKTLRDGAKADPLEEKILSYFETCGNWPGPCGEKVADTYYTLLPAAVMRDMKATPDRPA